MRKTVRHVVVDQSLLPERKRVGVGTVIKNVIHSVVSKAPISKRAKAAILSCNGCSQREEALNSMFSRKVSK